MLRLGHEVDTNQSVSEHSSGCTSLIPYGMRTLYETSRQLIVLASEPISYQKVLFTGLQQIGWANRPTTRFCHPNFWHSCVSTNRSCHSLHLHMLCNTMPPPHQATEPTRARSLISTPHAFRSLFTRSPNIFVPSASSCVPHHPGVGPAGCLPP